jgi:hypothetical protein
LTTTEHLRVSLVPPQAGWSGLKIVTASVEYEHGFAYSPQDCITLLAEAVDGVFAGGADRTVALPDGSYEADIRLRRDRGAATVALTITEHRGYQRSSLEQRVPTVDLTVDVRVLGLAFWRALRQLQSQAGANYFANWHYEFPNATVARLGLRLKP